MSDVMVINSLEQLEQFFNKDQIFEIAIRDKNKKFRKFQKVTLDFLQNNQAAEKVKQAIESLNINNALIIKNNKLLTKVATLNAASLMFQTINLCTSVVGFSIIYKKMEDLDRQIGSIISEYKKSNQIETNYEYKQVISAHMDMLTRRKNEDSYATEELRELVDNEYNVLSMLIEVFLSDMTQDYEILLNSIYSLASMLSVSLRYYDESYHDKYSNGNEDFTWHLSHDKWMGIFDTLLSREYVEKLQDYCIFDMGLNTEDTDTYYEGLSYQVENMKIEVEENQTLLQMLKNPDIIKKYRDLVNEEVENEIKAAFEEAGVDLEDNEINLIYNRAMQEAKLAI